MHDDNVGFCKLCRSLRVSMYLYFVLISARMTELYNLLIVYLYLYNWFSVYLYTYIQGEHRPGSNSYANKVKIPRLLMTK